MRGDATIMILVPSLCGDKSEPKRDELGPKSGVLESQQQGKKNQDRENENVGGHSISLYISWFLI